MWKLTIRDFWCHTNARLYFLIFSAKQFNIIGYCVQYSVYIKVEYHANENPLKNSEKMAYVDQMLMYLIIIIQKKTTKKLTMLGFF